METEMLKDLLTLALIVAVLAISMFGILRGDRDEL